MNDCMCASLIQGRGWMNNSLLMHKSASGVCGPITKEVGWGCQLYRRYVNATREPSLQKSMTKALPSACHFLARVPARLEPGGPERRTKNGSVNPFLV